MEESYLHNNGRNFQAAIQLNFLIANINVALDCRWNGNFKATSQNCDLESFLSIMILHYNFQISDGYWTSLTKNLDLRIVNRMENLN